MALKGVLRFQIVKDGELKLVSKQAFQIQLVCRYDAGPRGVADKSHGGVSWRGRPQGRLFTQHDTRFRSQLKGSTEGEIPAFHWLWTIKQTS